MPDIVTQTERLTLRVPCMDDIDTLAGYWADPETMKYIGKGGTPWTREQVAERIERGIRFCAEHGMTFWTVIENETDTIIGQGGLVPIAFNGPEIELGYRLGRPHWGRGYATEIAKASARVGFELFAHDRLVAVSYPENDASRKVLSKVGFEERGLSDKYYETTSMLYELTKKRWAALHS